MDSFSDLTWGGKPKSSSISTAKLNSLPLAERQKVLAKSASSANARTSDSNAWSGLDLLGSLDPGSSPSAPGGSSTPSTGSNANVFNSGGSLLDGFDDIPSVIPSASQTPQPVPAQEIPEDDPFEVFNKPVVASKTANVIEKNGREEHASSHANFTTERSRYTTNRTPENDDNLYGDNLDAPIFQQNQEFDDYADNETPVNRSGSDPRDRSIAELIDMGFSDEQAIEALANTSDGVDVRQAVDYIMSEAHRKATGQPAAPRKPARPSRSNLQASILDPNADYGKMAQDIGTQLFSSASSFLNKKKKQLAKTIEQYNNQGSKDGVPAWMRGEDASALRSSSNRATGRASESNAFSESEDMPPRPRRQQPSSSNASRNTSSSSLKSSAKPESGRIDRSELLSRIPKAGSRSNTGSGNSSPVPDLSQQFKDQLIFTDDDMPMAPRRKPGNRTSGSATPSSVASSSTPPAKPKVERPVVSMSSIQMDMASQARSQGTDAFKRGDFVGAENFYSQALQSIPPDHLLRVVLLSNRCTCYYKAGDFSSALKDVEEGLKIIGDSKGVGEEAEPGKPLKDFWGKLMTKKAESLEGIEKFKESLNTWELLLNNGFSSAATLDGKRRCQAALQPKPPTRPSRSPTPKTTSTTSSKGPTSASGIAAVERVKKANADSVQSEAEKFALHDSIEERVANWKNGKEDNLRALLSSLDSILWEELNWKKVSLAELVLPKKVKIIYMKAVAKTHPDKLPTNATTEQKMISQSVFITLNGAWEGFKTANNM